MNNENNMLRRACISYQCTFGVEKQDLFDIHTEGFKAPQPFPPISLKSFGSSSLKTTPFLTDNERKFC